MSQSFCWVMLINDVTPKKTLAISINSCLWSCFQNFDTINVDVSRILLWDWRQRVRLCLWVFTNNKIPWGSFFLIIDVLDVTKNSLVLGSRRKQRSPNNNEKPHNFANFRCFLFVRRWCLDKKWDGKPTEMLVFNALGPQVLWFVGSGRVPGLGNLTINQKQRGKWVTQQSTSTALMVETEAWVW